MITFFTRLTKKGNIKVPADIQRLMIPSPGDAVLVTVGGAADDLDNDSVNVRVPTELFEEAGIDSGNLMMYVVGDSIVIEEAHDDE